MNTPDKPRGAVLDGQPASVEHVAARLWDAAVDGDEDTAGEIALRALRSGMTAETVLLDVIGAVQRKVGEEWAANRLTVTQEHSVTAINDRVVAAVSRAVGPAESAARPGDRRLRGRGMARAARPAARRSAALARIPRRLPRSAGRRRRT